MPAGLARSVLKRYHQSFRKKSPPLGGNFLPPLAAKLQSRLLGTGNDIIRRQKGQERTDLGSQVWFSCDQTAGDLSHWAFIVHDLVENSATK